MLKGDEMYEGHIKGHGEYNEEGNKHLIRESQTKRKGKRERRYTQEIMADNFSSLMRKIQI